MIDETPVGQAFHRIDFLMSREIKKIIFQQLIRIIREQCLQNAIKDPLNYFFIIPGQKANKPPKLLFWTFNSHLQVCSDLRPPAASFMLKTIYNQNFKVCVSKILFRLPALPN